MPVSGPRDEAMATIAELPFPVRRRRARASAGPPSGPVDDPEAWLLRSSPGIETVGEVLDGLCWRLVRAGVPLSYVHIGSPTLHPQVMGLGCRWWRDQRVVEEVEIAVDAEDTEILRESPLRATFLDGAERRFHLEAGEGADRPVLRDLARLGTSDLVAMPMPRLSGYFPFVAWATDVSGGFLDGQIGRLRNIMAPLAAIFAVRLARRATADLLDVYLGREAGPKVLAGAIRRGRGERRQAVIMAVDLRRSTWLSDHLPALTMIELLDACFEQICRPVLAEGGDILKFIGDGVLAVFPAGDDATQATRAALTASAAALAGLVQVTRERPDFLLRSPVAGIGLHRGDVFYGNVGAAERLDFTVIGPAVNLAFRIETLTKLLGRPLLLSGQVAAGTVPAPVSLGLHSVHGLDQPIEVFAPADGAL